MNEFSMKYSIKQTRKEGREEGKEKARQCTAGQGEDTPGPESRSTPFERTRCWMEEIIETQKHGVAGKQTRQNLMIRWTHGSTPY